MNILSVQNSRLNPPSVLGECVQARGENLEIIIPTQVDKLPESGADFNYFFSTFLVSKVNSSVKSSGISKKFSKTTEVCLLKIRIIHYYNSFGSTPNSFNLASNSSTRRCAISLCSLSSSACFSATFALSSGVATNCLSELKNLNFDS
ncbi:hypothetical protein Cylst_1766 [Cylindrospermum stagnale PCC 7417]|uniref:Uncharacterized protein n=1 Tax=Cylindrospermum stagnale PCC 7417 TaxID=56107 RepID=K9WW66_9NOST|nr:hypothetical protein Cylst_1766 [Cylindrospermum stagnale PCC 7417]